MHIILGILLCSLCLISLNYQLYDAFKLYKRENYLHNYLHNHVVMIIVDISCIIELILLINSL
jgi:hypothetical protein